MCLFGTCLSYLNCTVRREEATEPLGTSEKLKLEVLVPQKQTQVDTHRKDDHQQAKPSQVLTVIVTFAALKDTSKRFT